MKHDGRSFSHEVLETYRFAAVRLRKSGVSVEVIAKSLRVTRKAVDAWLAKAHSEGMSSLKAKKAAGPAPILGPSQARKLQSLLRQPATKVGYSTDLWSGPKVRHLIKHRFGIEYHPKHMPRLLTRVGLEIRFPERRALEQDPKAVRVWKRQRLPAILADAAKTRAMVFYADESLISLIPYVGKTWAFPGQTPIVRVSGRRGQHVGVTAAVNRQGRMCFELTKDKERFTARVFIRFLKKMRTEFPRRRLVLIVDGATTHTAKIVKQFATEEKSWLRLEILPAYSPELNPTEKSWRFVKTKKLNGSTARNKVDLRKTARKSLREVRKDKDRIISFFED
jgi:transposase